MAQKQAGPALVMVALFLFAAATPTAYGQGNRGGLLGLGPILTPILGPILGPVGPVGPILTPVGPVLSPLSPVVGPVVGSVINGTVCCGPSGNCNGTTPALQGVGVKVTCVNLLGVSVLVGQGSTNINGTFNISITNIGSVIGNTLAGTLPCVISIDLPILNKTVCPLLSTVNGTLVGVPIVLNSLLSQVQNLIASVPLFIFLAFNLGTA